MKVTKSDIPGQSYIAFPDCPVCKGKGLIYNPDDDVDVCDCLVPVMGLEEQILHEQGDRYVYFIALDRATQ